MGTRRHIRVHAHTRTPTQQTPRVIRDICKYIPDGVNLVPHPFVIPLAFSPRDSFPAPNGLGLVLRMAVSLREDMACLRGHMDRSARFSPQWRLGKRQLQSQRLAGKSRLKEQGEAQERADIHGEHLWWRSIAPPELLSKAPAHSTTAFGLQASTHCVFAAESLQAPCHPPTRSPCYLGPGLGRPSISKPMSGPLSLAHTTHVSTHHILGFSPTRAHIRSLSSGPFLPQVVLQGIGPQVLDDDLVGDTGRHHIGHSPLSLRARGHPHPHC